MREYELWAEFMRRTRPETWASDEIRADWLPVLGDDWRDWLHSNRFTMFVDIGEAIRSSLVVAVLSDKMYSELDRDKYLVYAVDVDAPIDAVLERIELRLRAQKNEIRPGRPSWKPNSGKYRLVRRPDLNALEVVLAAYDLRSEHHDWPMWRLGQELQKQFPILIRQKIVEDDASADQKIATRSQHTNQKKVLTQTVSRYLRTAETLLDGVRKGMFPS